MCDAFADVRGQFKSVSRRRADECQARTNGQEEAASPGQGGSARVPYANRRQTRNEEQTDMSQIPGNLRDLASRMAELQEQARSLGLFPGNRELLECPKCGLLEDVTIEGKLITYVSSAEGQDSGFRFEETSPGRFRCQACGSIFHED